MSFFVAAAGSAAAQVPDVQAVRSCPTARVPATDPIEQQRIKRLVTLSEVWGKVKFFHPLLAYKAIEWDAALMAAIPKVSAGKNAQDFADAVKEMLATLGDPDSTVAEHAPSATPRPLPTDPHPNGHMTPDRVLVISMTNYADLIDRGAIKRVSDLAKRLVEATAVVVDLRNLAGTSSEAGEWLIQHTVQLVGKLVDTSVTGPGRRRRLYMGFPGQTESGPLYVSNFLVWDGKTFPAAQAAEPRPIVFVINRGSTVPEIALALQDAGKAAIVLDGYASEEVADLSWPLSIHLEGPFSAKVRSSELVWSDGTGGFSANLVVAPVAGAEREDPALDAALRLARDFKVGRPVRSRVPGLGTLRHEARYPDLASLSLEHRLLAAFRMHNVVQHFFPYRDIMGEDWDQVLREFIPRFEAAADPMSYSLCVAEMWTHIHDSHGAITTPHFLQYFGSARPPLRVRWIEGAVVIDQILDPSAVEPTGLKLGDVVLGVDGEDIAQRMARMGRYIPASTPQAHRRDICIVLLDGAPGTTARLRIRNANGEEREVEIARSMQRSSPLARTPRRSGQPLRWLSDSIGYANLEPLTEAQVDDLFTMFAGAKAIVFDVRGYPGVGPWDIARRLTDRARVPAVLYRQPRVSAESSRYGTDALGDVTEVLDFVAAPRPDRPVFRGLTVLLINEDTQSLGEHVGLFLKAANDTAWIGGASAGAHGDVTTLVVPGGITLPFTGQAVLHPDFRQLQRVGLTPDVEVHPTIAGLRAGRDEVLEAALATIQKRLAGR